MIHEAVRKGLRIFRRSRTYRDHHSYRHYDRTDLDRQTAAMLLTCWSSITVPGNFPVSDILYTWEQQRRHWELEIQPVAGRAFTIGDFVTFLLCLQEHADGAKLRCFGSMLGDEVDIIRVQEEQDAVMRDVERDLELAGFLASPTYIHRNLQTSLPI